jgi:hypothetical protein
MSALSRLRGMTQARRHELTATTYHVTDLLHDGRAADASCEGIAKTVSAWLAELGAETPLVEELARAVCAGNWPTAHAIGQRLSVDVTVAA